jgi:hypothetical protein
VSNNNQTSITTKNYTGAGFSFQYNAEWNITNDINQNNTSVVTVTDTQLQQTNGTKGMGASIVKIPTSSLNASGLNLQESKNNITVQAQQNGGNATLTNITITGLSASQIEYNASVNNTVFFGRQIDFEKNNNTFIISFLALGTDVNTAKANFDVIIKSFKVD